MAELAVPTGILRDLAELHQGSATALTAAVEDAPEPFDAGIASVEVGQIMQRIGLGLLAHADLSGSLSDVLDEFAADATTTDAEARRALEELTS